MVPVFVVVLFNGIGMGIIVPILPYFAVKFGASSITVTLLFSSFAAMQFIGGPIAGRLSDRFGRRNVLIFTLFGSALAYLLLAAANSVAMLFVARLFAGLMAGNMTVANAVMVDITTAETRAKGLGRIGAALALGFVIGPILGGLLTGVHSSLADNLLPGIVSSILYVCAFGMTMFGLTETLPPERRALHLSSNQSYQPFRTSTLLRDPSKLLLLSQFFVVATALNGLVATLALWADARMHWSSSQLAYVFAITSVPVFAMQFFGIGHFARKVGEPKILAFAACLVIIGSLTIVLSPMPAVVILGLAAFFPGLVACNPVLSTILSQQTLPQHQGSTLGVANSFFGLGQVFGPVIAGAGFAAVTEEWPFYAGLVLACSVLAFALHLQARRQALAADGIEAK
jgi:MFS family permease